MLYAMRVSLPDRPGVLGSVASAISRVPADIRSVWVVDHVGAYAVDEICIEAEGTSQDTLRDAVQSLPGVVVESVRRVGRIPDPLAPLELADLLARGIGPPVDVLVTGLPGAMGAEWALAVDTASGELEVLAATSGVPLTSFDTPWLPLDGVRRLPFADWYPTRWRISRPELAAAPLDEPSSAVIVGRTGAMTFRPAELRQLELLADMAVRAKRRRETSIV